MSSRTVFLAGYALIGLALLALVGLARHAQSRVASVSEMTDAAMRRRTGRIIVLILWWWIGFHVLARSA